MGRRGIGELYKGRMAEYHARNAVQQRAHRAVANAVETGKLIKPDVCSECGLNPSRIEGHHADYSKLLEVQWLCRKCHKHLHAELIRAAR